MAHRQESFHPFSSLQGLCCFLSYLAKGNPHSHVVPPLLTKAAWVPSSMAATPGFKSQGQSSSASPFLTPPAVSYTCQHSYVSLTFPGCHSKSQPAWPRGMEPVISKLSYRHCNQGELPPSYVMRWKSLPSPWLKVWPQPLNISMKAVKSYRYVTWPCLRLVAKLLLCKTALNGPAPCVPSSDLWRWGHPIFLIFLGHPEFWTLLQIPLWGPPWLHPVTIMPFVNFIISLSSGWCLSITQSTDCPS